MRVIANGALVGVMLAAFGAAADGAAQDEEAAVPSDAARQVAEAIRREAMLPPQGEAGRPLPLLSHWNMGSQGRGWTPDYQCELLDAGHHILPWMGWPQGDPDASEKALARFDAYYGRLLAYCRELKLPISFRGTQWEAMLVGKEYRERPPERSPAVLKPDGQTGRLLSPFGAVEPWKDPAGVYVDTPAMKKVQALYPDPPLVLFVSNNEAPRLRWAKHGPLEEQSQRYLDRYGTGRSDEFKREAVGAGWKERYPVMFDAMRAALANETWRRNLRFVGYGAFGPSHFGRWGGWKVYSLECAKWVDPEPLFWDGSSPSYYTHNWDDTRDHWVFSTQIESMNWIFMLDRVFAERPDFWWEVSTWDGNNKWTPGMAYDPELLKHSKACQYMKAGQTYTPDRHEGWAQYGLWLLRPRVYREFRGSTVPRAPWQPFFDRMLAIVDRVHRNETLAAFWRHGTLVPNRAHEHPFQANIPERYRGETRWFLLDTNLDAPRPWSHKTDIPVFSLALVRGDKGARQWLVYAHSPLEDKAAVQIALPEYGNITIDVPRKGAFYTVREGSREVVQL